MKFADVASKLEVGKQYTLVGMSDFGFPYTVQMKLTEATAKKYAQYNDALLIKFIVKGKRKETGMYFYGIKDLVIWEGFVNPNVEMYGAATESNGVIIRQSKGMSFDKLYMQTAINSVAQTAIVSITKELIV